VLPDSTLPNLFVVLNKSIASPGDVGLEVMRSTDQGVTWSAPTSINTLQSIGIRDAKLNLPIPTGDLIPSIAVDRSTGAVYIAWEDARFSGGQRDGIVFAKSTDGKNNLDSASPSESGSQRASLQRIHRRYEWQHWGKLLRLSQ
jgi:hypothetical protein